MRTAPATTGSSAIVSYTATAALGSNPVLGLKLCCSVGSRSDLQSAASASGASSPLTISGVAPGVYSVTVTATNANGTTSDPSAAASVTVGVFSCCYMFDGCSCAGSVPSQPVVFVYVPEPVAPTTVIVVGFSSTSPYVPILSYTITSAPAGYSNTVTTGNSVTITGLCTLVFIFFHCFVRLPCCVLAAGTFSFSVTATNSAGTSTAGVTNSVTVQTCASPNLAVQGLCQAISTCPAGYSQLAGVCKRRLFSSSCVVLT